MKAWIKSLGPWLTASGSPKDMPGWVFVVWVLWALGLLGLFLAFVHGEDRLDLPHSFGKVPVEAPWLGAVGGLVASLGGITYYSRGRWESRFNYWHPVKPLMGAASGSVSCLFLIVIVRTAAGTTPTKLDSTALDAAAFVFGFAESSFRELIKAVTDVFLKPGAGAKKANPAAQGNGAPDAQPPGPKQPSSPAFAGGVPATPAPTATPAPGELQAPSRSVTRDSNFGYQGGPIIAAPEVHACFLGPRWAEGANVEARARLVQFLQDFLASDYMNILSQYGVGAGAGRCGRWSGDFDVAAVKAQMSDADIHALVHQLIGAGTLAEPASPSNLALMIFLDETVEINDPSLGVTMCEPQGDTAFGYHNYCTTVAGNKAYYSIIPALDDKCLQESCPSDEACSLRLAATQEQRRTQVASHEFSEMVTDPEISAWRDPKNGQENGDICNGRSATIAVEGRVWTVQQMYSNVADRNGEPACVVGAPEPLPPLPMS